MKLLITGFNGFVAGSIIAQAKGDWEIHGIGRTENPIDEPGIYYHSLDLLDSESFNALFKEIAPDAVIHAAAMANIDICQANQEQAEQTNVEVTKMIAKACQEHDVKMVFCSTDTIFDGLKGDYIESDKPNGINYYAQTKIRAEGIVLSASQKNAVGRLALVMGIPVIGKGNSFLADTISKLEQGIQVPFPENEIRTPIDVITLGAALIELAGNQFGGILHLGGSTKINRYEMGLVIAKALGYSSELILSTNSNAMPGRAPRAEDASMDNSLAKRILKTPMLTLAEGLNLTLNFNAKK